MPNRDLQRVLKAWVLVIAGFTLLGVLAAVSLVNSTGTYAFLYWLLIPKGLHQVPVYFDFSPDCLAATGGPIAVADLLQPQQW